MARFLCTGDLHLDAGPDLGRVPGDRLREQEEVWRRCLEIGAEHEVDAVLFAGDAFEHRRPTPEALLAFERPLVALDEGPHPVPMYAIVGNHDRSGAAAGTGLEIFAEASLLSLASEPEIWHFPAAGQPDAVAICALPWAPVSRIVAAHGGADRDDANAYAAELLVATARGLREQVDGPAILLTHFSISGSSLPNGLPVEQLREPVLEVSVLEALGFDAIVAGHIHRGQTFGEGATFYVGSPLPLSFGEASDEHGVWILETDPRTASGAQRPLLVPRFIPIASRRLVTLTLDGYELDVPEAAGGNMIDWEDHAVEGAIVRVRIHAIAEQARRLDIAAFKRALYDAGAHKVYAVQLEVERPERARVEGLHEELTELEALAAWCRANDVNGTREQALRERTERYLGAVRA